MAEPIDILKRLKKRHSYSKLSRLTGVPELTLIRWITGQCQMSYAWRALLKDKLSELE